MERLSLSKQFSHIQIFILLFFLPGSIFAETIYDVILRAESNGDYAVAVKMWQQLANQDDPIAQYNLALAYALGKGVKADKNIERHWSILAANKGLVQAYMRINPQSIRVFEKINSTVNTNVKINPKDWVANQNPEYFTLQLASSTNEELIKKYFNDNKLIDKAGYYSTQKEGEVWHALVYGVYPTVNDANAAISDLPEDLKKWSPWVRKISDVQTVMLQ